MSFYEVMLYLHIIAAALWLGGGVMLAIMGGKAERSGDPGRVEQILMDAGALANTFFIPASLAVLVLGLVMTIDAWAFDQLWIILGLLGYAATFVLGAAVLSPRSERAAKMIAERGMGPSELVEARKVLTLTRIDTALLLAIVFDMAVKPTADDVGALAVMAVILAIGVGSTVARYRSLEAEQPTSVAV